MRRMSSVRSKDDVNCNKVNTDDRLLQTLKKCGICSKCSLDGWDIDVDDTVPSKKIDSSTKEVDHNFCPLCWNVTLDSLRFEVGEALEPYGGWDKNNFSYQSPTVSSLSLSLLKLTQYAVQCALELENLPLRFNQNQSNKEWLKELLMQLEDEMNIKVSKKEDGCMHYYVLITPPSIYLSTTCDHPFFAKANQNYKPSSTNRRNKRRRWQGNDPTNKQGGDPRQNLEYRVLYSMNTNGHAKKNKWWQDKEFLDNTFIPSIVYPKQPLSDSKKILLVDWIQSCANGGPVSNVSNDDDSDTKFSQNQKIIHVAAWRHAFYLQAQYTKSRRDVSQTPFYVPSSFSNNGSPGGKKQGMVKKGNTSVEEEICPRIASIACGGISTMNNFDDDDDDDDERQKNSKPGKVVYGMCKFHASGREDLDVRMLFKPPAMNLNNNNEKENMKKDGIVGGRPFVCEVIDALRVPNEEDLEKAVHAINHTSIPSSLAHEEDEEKRYFGNNPNGVGISPDLSISTAHCFSNLQSETESKIKFYGCRCWSQDVIPNQQYLERKIIHSNSYPLKLLQSTPLRVLHRRAAAVRVRYIQSLHSCRRIDDHYFYLHMSTSAGTYVKEFVHGDCGRTTPSVSSMLGCKTDILELDCEGIAI